MRVFRIVKPKSYYCDHGYEPKNIQYRQALKPLVWAFHPKAVDSCAIEFLLNFIDSEKMFWMEEGVL